MVCLGAAEKLDRRAVKEEMCTGHVGFNLGSRRTIEAYNSHVQVKSTISEETALVVCVVGIFILIHFVVNGHSDHHYTIIYSYWADMSMPWRGCLQAQQPEQ
jgi:hypothetical protein